ncbi:MAG TPA: CBS domain-containing protein, partial [Anaerolineales bacterium]|nr:CBS domain-containing protein [Anaerolineales bacterium]
MAPTKSQTEQEKYGRHRPVTDRDAHEINRIEELSYDLKVHEVMIANVITTTSDVPISSALELLRINRISGLPVVDNGILAGVISLEDIVRAMQKNELGKSVSEYMSTQIMTVNSYDSVVEAIKTFSEKRLGRLPVID